jgi:GMC oxidoreductase
MDLLVRSPSATRITIGLSQVCFVLSTVPKLTCTDNFFRALHELGVPTVYDPDEGVSAGGYFLASDIHPQNQTRSDARRAYYDPYISRKNYNVIPNSHVTRILFESPYQDLPLYGASVNGSQDIIGNLSISQSCTSMRKVRQSEKRQRNTRLPLHATGVEVKFSSSSPHQSHIF